MQQTEYLDNLKAEENNAEELDDKSFISYLLEPNQQEDQDLKLDIGKGFSFASVAHIED